LYELVAKPILVDTSFGVTTQDNTWSSATTDTLNARIGDGVAAVLVNPTPAGYQSQIEGYQGQLQTTCQ
jgi:hypothetical protein